MNKCHGNGCCCKCRYKEAVHCHPLNHGPSHGALAEVFGFVCSGLKADDKSSPLIFFEGKHGCGCEMFAKKEKLRK